MFLMAMNMTSEIGGKIQMECLADLRHLDFCITTTLQYQGVICRARQRALKRTTQMPPLTSPTYFFSLLIPTQTLRQLPAKG